jgi:hypothetical protein
MVRSPRVLGVLLGGIAAWVTPATATVVRPLTVADLTSRAQVVVQGRVLDQVGLWDSQKRGIYTHTRIEVLKCFKGDVPDKEILVRQLGGRSGGYVMGLPGNAPLQVGEEVVLFLTRDSHYHYVVGLAQGKFAVLPDGSGRKVVSRDLSGLSFARWDPGGKMILSRRLGLVPPTYLDELEAEVKAALLKERGK